MRAKNIIILGTLDTKGDQIGFFKDCIESKGHMPLVLDLSMGSEPLSKGDITPAEIARAAGRNLGEIKATKERALMTEVMEGGAKAKIRDLLSKEKIDGIIALGGASMALMGSHIMRVLPFGIPKMIVCPAAMPAYVGQWFHTMDIAVMQSILEFAGLNDLLKSVLARAAGAICGMVEDAPSVKSLTLPKGSVAITQFGISENCAKHVRKYLEEKGYSVNPFHAQGISDQAMDLLIGQGFFDGVIEIVPAGVIEEIFEGNRAPGPRRLEAAGKRGIPQVIAPCAINLTGCGPTRKHPEKYEGRPQIKMDNLRAMTRYNTNELTRAAKVYAEKFNEAKGPIKIIFPLRGWSSFDREGSVLFNPKEDMVFVKELKRQLKDEIETEELDCNLENPAFSRALVESLDAMMKRDNYQTHR
jgi:uncharacterized protein (UPF0261 family)